MFAFSLALPFTLFAAFPKWMERLPKSGGWLQEVKVVLGFLELALALKFLSIADQVCNQDEKEYFCAVSSRSTHVVFPEVYLGLLP